MARPAGAFKNPAQARNANACAVLHTRWVNFVDLRQEQRIAALPLQSARVIVGSARVAREILASAELGGIDEDAGNHGRTGLAGRPDQRIVAGMQVAHGGHESDATFALPLRSSPRAQIRNFAKDLHACLSRNARGLENGTRVPPAHKP